MTIERVMGRAIEDVREFVTDQLDNYIEMWKQYEEDDIPMATSIAHDISANQMLEKEQAKWLKQFLDKDMNDKIESLIRDKQGLDLSDIDELSIYADAWGLYCRPGTYSIDI